MAAKLKFTAAIEINIDQARAGHFNWRILLDGHSYVISAASSAPAALTAAALWLNRKCKKCGCTFLNGCVREGHETFEETFCHWVTPDLCSHCVPKRKAKS